MSRFISKNNNKLFVKKKPTVIINNPVEIEIVNEPEIINEPEIVSVNVEVFEIPEPQIEEIKVEEVNEPEINEPIIKLEDIYKDVEPEIHQPIENPQQIELKKRKSKEKFKLLVEEIILNRKKELIDGWSV